MREIEKTEPIIDETTDSLSISTMGPYVGGEANKPHGQVAVVIVDRSTGEASSKTILLNSEQALRLAAQITTRVAQALEFISEDRE